MWRSKDDETQEEILVVVIAENMHQSRGQEMCETDKQCKQ